MYIRFLILDIDECDIENTCKNGHCENIDGSFICHCNGGFKHKSGTNQACEGRFQHFYCDMCNVVLLILKVKDKIISILNKR